MLIEWRVAERCGCCWLGRGECLSQKFLLYRFTRKKESTTATTTSNDGRREREKGDNFVFIKVREFFFIRHKLFMSIWRAKATRHDSTATETSIGLMCSWEEDGKGKRDWIMSAAPLTGALRCSSRSTRLVHFDLRLVRESTTTGKYLTLMCSLLLPTSNPFGIEDARKLILSNGAENTFEHGEESESGAVRCIMKFSLDPQLNFEHCWARAKSSKSLLLVHEYARQTFYINPRSFLCSLAPAFPLGERLRRKKQWKSFSPHTQSCSRSFRDLPRAL